MPLLTTNTLTEQMDSTRCVEPMQDDDPPLAPAPIGQPRSHQDHKQPKSQQRKVSCVMNERRLPKQFMGPKAGGGGALRQ